MDVRPGQVLRGRYHYSIEEVIYQGASSLLCAASVQETGQRVHIRVLADTPAEYLSAKLQCELAQLNAIDSTCFPRILDHNAGDGAFFVVTEGVAGALLSQVLTGARDGRLHPPVAIHYLHQLAEGLAALARSGLAHGEIRAQNVIVTPEGQVRLLGLGVARAAIATKQRNQSALLPYVAPELLQLGNPGIDGRTDIYAFGALAYQMLTGHPPFEGRDVDDLVYMIVMDARSPASRLNPALNDCVDVFLDRCLAKDPDDRFQTALELLAALDTLPLPVGEHGPACALALVSDAGTRYAIPEPEALLGRGQVRVPGTPVIDLSGEVHGRTVSRRQARLQRERDRWLLTPLPDTTNPTLLNGRRLHVGAAHALQQGDELRIGGVRLVVHLPTGCFGAAS